MTLPEYGFLEHTERAPLRKPWFAIAATTIGVTGLVIFAEGQLSGIGSFAAARLSIHASLLATLLLALSAVLYLAYALVRDQQVGRAASALAATGASGVIAASLVRWVEVEWLAPGTLDYAGQYELLTWLAAIAVYIYLCIEDIYETRLAGGFVLPTAVASLGLAAWLIAVSPVPERTFMALAAAYVDAGMRVSAAVGIGALGVTGALSIAGLVGSRSVVASPDSNWQRWPLRGPPVYEWALRWAMLVGLCAFTLAAMLGFARQFVMLAVEFKSGISVLWPGIALSFFAWQLRRAPRDRFSWYVLIAMGLGGIGAFASYVIAAPGGVVP